MLKNVTTSVVHGDIHAGNIMIRPEGQMVFIDLDVCDNGLSWYDLASNSCLLNNDDYYTGLVNGYFENNIPEEFWKVYTFCGCLYCLDYIQYSIRTDNLGLSHGLSATNNFINTTNELNGEVPNWYKKVKIKALRRESV